tara:strand:+ start:441 stop:1097 length:657 start_codon:yes stop_codon:yes gene_type:complete
MWWCSPIIWHDNINLPEDLYAKICETVTLKDGNYYYTTYGKDCPEWDDDVMHSLVQYYQDIIQYKMLMELGLNYRSDWHFNFWIQGSNSRSLPHKPHTHFSGDEIISWCHIIKASPNEKCFYFMRNVPEELKEPQTVGKKNYSPVAGQLYEKIYPEQESGDINAWPAWSMHGVDLPSNTDTRIVIAGNVALSAMTDGESIMKGKREGDVYSWEIGPYS